MKIQHKGKSFGDNIIKKKKNKPNGDNKTEVKKNNILKKKEKSKIENGTSSLSNLNKKKLKESVQKSDIVKNVLDLQKQKKSNQSVLLKPIKESNTFEVKKKQGFNKENTKNNSENVEEKIKKSKNKEEKQKKIMLKPDMSTSELLRSLDTTISKKQANETQKPTSKFKMEENKLHSEKNNLVQKKKKSKEITKVSPKVNEEQNVNKSDAKAKFNKPDKVKKPKSQKENKNTNFTKNTNVNVQNATTLLSKNKNVVDKKKIKLQEPDQEIIPKAVPLLFQASENKNVVDKKKKKTKLQKSEQEVIPKEVPLSLQTPENKNVTEKKKNQAVFKKLDAADISNNVNKNKKNNNVKEKVKFSKTNKVKKTKSEQDDRNKSDIKVRKALPSLKQAPKFDENNFKAMLNLENITKTVQAIKNLVEKESEKRKNTIFKDYRYVVDFGLFKIPNAPKRIVKLNVKHSIVGPDDDIIFIVKDLKRGIKIDYEPTIHHYEDLLREKGIKNIKTIMPFNQLKKEYTTYEMKRKLSNLYEYFICDSAIVAHVFGFLGKIFSSKPRCAIYSVRCGNESHLKNEVRKALHRTSFKQGAKGNTFSIICGSHTNSIKEVAENISVILDQLKSLLPGGHQNIRSIMIKVNLFGTSSLPLYINMGMPPKMTPYVIGTKERKINKLKEKAEEILEKFTFTNDGSVEKLSLNEMQIRKRKLQSKADTRTKKIKTEKAIVSTKKVEAVNEQESEDDENEKSEKINDVDSDDNNEDDDDGEGDDDDKRDDDDDDDDGDDDDDDDGDDGEDDDDDDDGDDDDSDGHSNDSN